MRKRGERPPTNIKDLFEVYRTRLRAPQGSVISAATEVIHDLLGLQVEKTLLSYSPQTRVLHIHVRGPLKSEVLLHKKEILLHLTGRLGAKSAPTEII
jgi:hypothetical protein